MSTVKEWTPFELHHTYMRGWSAGAAVKAIDPVFSKHDNKTISDQYLKGYDEGRKARQSAAEKMCKITGYVPNILRTA